ncbi:hypothetical protein GH825_29265, partial [Bacillus thuringiensis]|nr:hypothetical protein [Bacillus thuringiensis]
MFRLADDVATEIRHCHVATDVYDEVLVDGDITDCVMNSVIRKLSQRLSLSIPEETDIFCDMNDNVYTRHLVVKLDTTISIVTGSNMNNNNDAPARDGLMMIGKEVVVVLMGCME